MTWYYIVFIVLAYLIMGSIATGLIKRFNKIHNKRCMEDEYVGIFLFWPIIVISKMCIFAVKFIAGDYNKFKN